MSTVLYYYVCIVTAVKIALGEKTAVGEEVLKTSDLLNEPWLAVFVNQPNVVVEEGASVELECSAEATPVAVIHWLFNGKRITVGSHENELNIVEKVNNEGIRTLQDSITRSKLRIGCVNKNTVGRYECVAVNGYLTESANATIKMVKESNNNVLSGCTQKRYADLSTLAKPAEIYMWTDSRLERSGVTVQLMCRSKGNPSPRTMWYEYKSNPNELDDETQFEEIKNNDQYQLLQNGDLLTKIPENPVEGGTVYKCVVSNPWGHDSVTIVLNWPLISDTDGVKNEV